MQRAPIPVQDDTATYLFADVDRGPPWQAIRRQPGVVSIVMTGDSPSRCPESEIEKLRASGRRRRAIRSSRKGKP